ncbi:MAG TPA: calcineurin-like phosphoesterase family protein [Longimicrobiales bacterium]|nr:calcineurin-like phosphoesterase family protein [Longimicrobiales bacterium]
MLDRRAFLATAAGLAAGLTLPERILADPYAPLASPRRGSPVRVRGRVRAGGRGVGGVAVTDGLTVVATDGDGRFELRSSSDRDFVSCSLPSGYHLPVGPSGTARFYRPIAPGSGGDMEALFELERLEGGDERHAMLLLADIQTQDRWEMERFHEQSVPDVIATLRSLGEVPAFGIACGDIMFDDLSLFPEYERGVARMGIPFFQVVGNHDLDQEARTDEASTATFSRHFGPRYYSFDRGAVHYVVLDDVFWYGTGYLGYLDRDQLAWLAADLARVEAGRPVVVALHIPAQGTEHIRNAKPVPEDWNTVNNREALVRLLEPYRAHVVSGHTHENEHGWAPGLHEHVVGTVCGAWWSGPLCCDGAPNGYAVYEVDGEEVRWRYKGTGLPADHQLRAYLPGADPRCPDELVVNVWDADEGWTVVWYEDGERRGRMARRVGHDPVSVRIHAGDALPPRRTWADPYPRQLYYAPVTSGLREVRVEATDRFGRTYSAVAGPVPEGMKAWDPAPVAPGR